MGGDGGSLNNSRMELVRVRKDMMAGPDKSSVEKRVREKDRWTTCAVSRERLSEPVVACRLGYLYNKDALIKLLLDKERRKRMPEFSHLRSLKDVIPCKLEPADGKEAVFKCPVTMKEALGGIKFVVMWGCGHVLSEQAVNEVGKGNADRCVLCGEAPVEAVALHPDDKVRAELREKLGVKRSKKRKGGPEADGRHGKDAGPPKPAKSVKSAENGAVSSTYASLFTSSDGNAHRNNARGSFTGVSLRPSGT